MKHIFLFFARLFGFFSQEPRAKKRADECLQLCQMAFFEKAFAESCSEKWRNAWNKEQFYSRNHNRFWRLAWRRLPFKETTF